MAEYTKEVNLSLASGAPSVATDDTRLAKLLYGSIAERLSSIAAEGALLPCSILPSRPAHRETLDHRLHVNVCSTTTVLRSSLSLPAIPSPSWTPDTR
jgi:hypothetical protein